MGEGNKSMELGSQDSDNSDAQSSKEKSTVVLPVVLDAGSSGTGLPYAPENWPSPGDIWAWRVGKRASLSGHWLDRSVYPPTRLRNLGKNKSGFHSRKSLKQYIQAEYPETDIVAFFDSFSWKIPSTVHQQNEGEIGGTYKSTKTSEGGAPKSKSSMKPANCKAGNKMCNLGGKARGFYMVAQSCDICCSEPGFCRDCCCILCSRTVDWSFGGYSFIRCEAIVDEDFICGHVAHVECALRACLGGKVGEGVDLDAQYFCRRCDNISDLTSHVTKLIKTCESLDSQDDIERILNVGLSILSGSDRDRSKILQNRIALIKAKGSPTNNPTV